MTMTLDPQPQTTRVSFGKQTWIILAKRRPKQASCEQILSRPLGLPIAPQCRCDLREAHVREFLERSLA